MKKRSLLKIAGAVLIAAGAFFTPVTSIVKQGAEVLRACRATVSGSVVNYPMLRFLRPGKSMPWWRLSYFRTRIQRCPEKYSTPIALDNRRARYERANL
jgi:hypothetical protein